jgi:hypothetical protein
MGCPSGCVNGGGQPIQPASVRKKIPRIKTLWNLFLGYPSPLSLFYTN